MVNEFVVTGADVVAIVVEEWCRGVALESAGICLPKHFKIFMLSDRLGRSA